MLRRSSAGFEVAGYTTQAQFLMAADLDTRVAALVNEHGEQDARAQAEQAHALRQLLLPGEMGETKKTPSSSPGGKGAKPLTSSASAPALG